MARKLRDLPPGKAVQFEFELPVCDDKVAAVRMIFRATAEGVKTKAVGMKTWTAMQPWAEIFPDFGRNAKDWPDRSHVPVESLPLPITPEVPASTPPVEDPGNG